MPDAFSAMHHQLNGAIVGVTDEEAMETGLKTATFALRQDTEDPHHVAREILLALGLKR